MCLTGRGLAMAADCTFPPPSRWLAPTGGLFICPSDIDMDKVMV